MLLMMQASLNSARRESGINVPDQHVYKVVGGAADGAMVPQLCLRRRKV